MERLRPGLIYRVQYDAGDSTREGYGRAVSDKEVLWYYTNEDLREISSPFAGKIPDGAFVSYGTPDHGHIDAVNPALCTPVAAEDGRSICGNPIVGFVSDPNGEEQLVLYPSRIARDASDDVRVGVGSSLSYTRPEFERAVRNGTLRLESTTLRRTRCRMCNVVRDTRHCAIFGGSEHRLGPLCAQRVRHAMEVRDMLS